MESWMDTLLFCSFFQLGLAPYILIFPHNHHGWKVFCSATSNSRRIGYFHWALESFLHETILLKVINNIHIYCKLI